MNATNISADANRSACAPPRPSSGCSSGVRLAAALSAALGIPAAVEAQVQRALAKDRDERYPQGGAFAAALRDAGRRGAASRTAAEPLPAPPNLRGYHAAHAAMPDIPHLAVFDTAFHQTMPAHAYRYALPEAWYSDYRVRRYGFHGTSHHYVARQAAAFLQQPLTALNLIPLPLGNGASAAAIRKLAVPDVAESLGYVFEAVSTIRKELDGMVPLIGFAGSPWTVGTYMVEGGSSREFPTIKGLAKEDPKALDAMLDIVVQTTTQYLNAQVEAGAQFILPGI